MRISDEAFILNRSGEQFYGKEQEVLSEENISKSFDVKVVVDEIEYKEKLIRNIIPVSLA